EELVNVHRRHLGTKKRDARREAAPVRGGIPAASSAALASALVGDLTSPTQVAVRAEQIARLRGALDALEPLDREVLALRHFEQLSRGETAEVLEISEDAAAKRYVRALGRLREVLARMPGG